MEGLVGSYVRTGFFSHARCSRSPQMARHLDSYGHILGYWLCVLRVQLDIPCS